MRLRYLGGAIAPDNQPLSNAPTAVGAAAQYQGSFSRQDVIQAETRGLWVADPDPVDQTTVMNINADNAANALQNNTFIDGAQNLPVTRTGNLTQGSFNPFVAPDGTWSNTFGAGGGTTAHLATPSTSALSFGTNNFSFEVTAYATSWPAVWRFITTAQPFSINGDTTSGLVKLDLGAGGVSTGITLPINTWFHFAVTRQSGTVRAFLNGVLLYTVANATNFSAVGITYIAGIASFSQSWAGHISNMRVLNNAIPTAYQTAITTLGTLVFNPPTSPLTPVSGTVLLTCQNYRFVDNSASALTLTPVGDATVSTFSPFYTPYTYKNNTFGASMAFSGTAQYLTLGGQSNFAFGTADFTIEFFVFYTSIAANSFIYDSRPNGVLSGLYPTIYNDVAARTFVFYTNTAARITSNAGVLNAGVWTHVAVSRVSGTTRMFINGLLQTQTYADTNSYLNGTSRPIICADGNATGTAAVAGNVSNLRVLNGTGLYTTNFTTPTQPLQAITNTQLLTCQGGTVDTSANAFTITNTGPATVSTLGPFTTYVNQTFRSWPAGSIYFDGATTYLNLNGSSTLAFGSNNFSIAMWVYFNAVTTEQTLYDGRAVSTGSGPQPAIILNGTSTDKLSYYVNGATRILSDSALTAGQWYYIDISRVSSVTRMYINGVVQTQTWADTTVYTNPANRPVIGAYADVLSAGFMVGFIYGVQVRNGSASSGSFPSTYPGFSPNTTPNAVLYLSGVNAGMYDTVGFTDYQTLGNAQVSTTAVNYGSGSMFFDGTGDWLISTVTTNNANPLNLMLFQGDFTIEAWVNPFSLFSTRSIISKGAAATGWTFGITSAGRLQFIQTSTTYTGASSSIVLYQWFHVAVVRSGTGADNLRMYVNGILDFVSTAAVTTNFNQTELVYVGADRVGTTPMSGYMADLRVTKSARYLNNFVPPKATLPKH